MENTWFAIVAFMLAMYVVLDGFDLGAGIIHLFVAKNDNERRLVLNSIGPVWDGNEVWLLAAGGALYLAFPKLYASSFSGFYLPIIIVLWLFMFRALGIELRHHIESDLWKKFWDASFSISSILLSIFFGAALGNVIRGVPIDETGYFFLPLWTDFKISSQPGILDWYTIIFGLLAFSTLAMHGANFISMKNIGQLHARSKKISEKFWWGVFVLSCIAFYFTNLIRPEYFEKLANNFIVTISFTISVSSLLLIKVFQKYNLDKFAFVSSSVFILSMLIVTAFGLFPNVLPSTINEKYSLTVYNTITSQYGLKVALYWWSGGILLAIGYFVYLFKSIKGKTKLEKESY